ncbi:MAG: hypothetical protein AMK70_03230 [Nitrospira bacterium SG8_35_1]|nr:MAG: hypothetical protein AMK70_03230 [Nitrospira bacterium SG8_35_1]
MPTSKKATHIINPITDDMNKDPYLIVDDHYLMQHLNLTKSFINQHARAMGSFSKPRRFFLKHVLIHLEFLALESIQKSNNRIKTNIARKRKIRRLIDLSLFNSNCKLRLKNISDKESE